MTNKIAGYSIVPNSNLKLKCKSGDQETQLHNILPSFDVVSFYKKL